MRCGTINSPGLSIYYRSRPGTVGRNSDLGNRLFVDAVIWKFRVGTPWRDLPERFGGWCNTHKRFSRWAVSGVWESLFKALADDPDADRLIEYAPAWFKILVGLD